MDEIQERLAQMAHWTEKPETRSDVKTLIPDERRLLMEDRMAYMRFHQARETGPLFIPTMFQKAF